VIRLRISIANLQAIVHGPMKFIS